MRRQNIRERKTLFWQRTETLLARLLTCATKVNLIRGEPVLTENLKGRISTQCNIVTSDLPGMSGDLNFGEGQGNNQPEFWDVGHTRRENK